MRIGIVGSGNMGSTLGTLWAKAGHDVLYSSRHPEELGEVVKATPRSKAVAIEVAAREGDVVFIGVPYSAMPELAKTLAPLLKGKLVLDAGNVVGRRDGALAEEVKKSGKGSGGWTQSLLPGARVVKAFNTVHFQNLLDDKNLGVPLAGDDAAAVEEAAKRVRETGHDPVLVPGGMAASARFDFGTAVWNKNMTGAQVRQSLGLPG